MAGGRGGLGQRLGQGPGAAAEWPTSARDRPDQGRAQAQARARTREWSSATANCVGLTCSPGTMGRMRRHHCCTRRWQQLRVRTQACVRREQMAGSQLDHLQPSQYRSRRCRGTSSSGPSGTAGCPAGRTAPRSAPAGMGAPRGRCGTRDSQPAPPAQLACSWPRCRPSYHPPTQPPTRAPCRGAPRMRPGSWVPGLLIEAGSPGAGGEGTGCVERRRRDAATAQRAAAAPPPGAGPLLAPHPCCRCSSAR